MGLKSKLKFLGGATERKQKTELFSVKLIGLSAFLSNLRSTLTCVVSCSPHDSPVRFYSYLRNEKSRLRMIITELPMVASGKVPKAKKPFIHSIHSFKKCLWSTYYVPCTDLGARGTEVKKTDKTLCPHGPYKVDKLCFISFKFLSVN